MTTRKSGSVRRDQLSENYRQAWVGRDQSLLKKKVPYNQLSELTKKLDEAAKARFKD